MSILSTVKKGYLYMKTSSGYLKLLPRTLASLVSLNNGNSVETEISNIKSAASNLSSTVSGHTTTLNSHGSSISAIKTKTDALKNAANKTVANNLTTTTDGYVLDARMGKSLQDSITTLDSTLEKKPDYRMLGSEVSSTTYEYLNDAKIYSKMINFGAMPNNTSKVVSTGMPNNVNYYWIDLANSFVFNGGACYPLTYVDCSNISNSITVSVIEKGTKLKIVTKSNWNTYSAFITIKYSTK